jgi:hypothetical protein
MKKNLFLKLLALVACLSSALSATAYSFVSGGIYYNITSTSNKTVEVTYKDASNGYSLDAYSGAVTIPSTVYYNGSYYTVTAIGNRAFSNARNLTSISIPNTVTSIGEYAFGYNYDGYSNQLTSVTIPYSVTTIGQSAFEKSYYLKTVSLGSGITEIPSRCFYECALTSVTIPDNVTSIGEAAFRANYDLTTANIGNNVTDIGNYAFYNCNSLATLKLGFHVMRIGAYAFGHNDGNHHPIHVYCYCVAPPTLDINAFDRWDNQGGYDGWVYTLARKVNTFKADSGWSRFGTSNFSSHSGNECYDFYYDRFYYILMENLIFLNL